MAEGRDFEMLDASGVRALEPEVTCAGAIYSKTDTSVDYGELTRALFQLAQDNGVKLVTQARVDAVSEKSDRTDLMTNRKAFIKCDLLINAAGGGALDLAHSLDLAKQYTDLHFRGEYWFVDEPFASKITRNIYSVARFKDFPFLDPHFIVRANGKREIGPNAVLVSGPAAYKGLSESKTEFAKKIFERPNTPKLKLFTNGRFLSLVWNEWRSSISKSAMCGRVKQFIPEIDASMLNHRGLAGVRTSLVNKDGFAPEAVLVEGERSFHILNYSSPGATGAPAFSAYIVQQLATKGYFDGLQRKSLRPHDTLWNFEDATEGL